MNIQNHPATEDQSPSTANHWRDVLGIAASLGCALHCAAMPLVIAYLPAFGLSWLVNETFHQSMAVVCFLLAAYAFVPGFQRHGRLTPVVLGLTGLTLITSAAFGLNEPCCPGVNTDAPSTTGIVDGSTSAACRFCEPSAVYGTTNAWWSAFDSIAPWLTPLGGMLLVAGHLVNRHCRCVCCRVLRPNL